MFVGDSVSILRALLSWVKLKEHSLITWAGVCIAFLSHSLHCVLSMMWPCLSMLRNFISGPTHVCSNPSLSMAVEFRCMPKSDFECFVVFSFVPGLILCALISACISSLCSLSFGRHMIVGSGIFHFLQALITCAWSSSSSASTFAVSGFKRPLLARTQVATSVTRVMALGMSDPIRDPQTFTTVRVGGRKQENEGQARGAWWFGGERGESDGSSE